MEGGVCVCVCVCVWGGGSGRVKNFEDKVVKKNFGLGGLQFLFVFGRMGYFC